MHNKEDNLLNLIYKNHQDDDCFSPPIDALIEWLDELFRLFFPIHKLSKQDVAATLETNKAKLHSITKCFVSEENMHEEYMREYYRRLEHLFTEVQLDAREIFNHDPAAHSISEVVNTYPGFYAIVVYRLAHLLYKVFSLPLLARVLSEHAHQKTGIDIHPHASIDVPFFIDHGTGIVIGETCVIGKRVKVYQGVTLGALQVSKEMVDEKRHPTIQDDVIIYANATILGGNTVVGNNTIIGGNVFLTHGVPPHSTVFSSNNIKIKQKKTAEDIINFII